MKIKYFCGLMFFCLFSCISNKESENVSNVIEIDLEGGSTCSVKSDSITELQIIPLEDKQEAMISQPKKMCISSNGYLILNKISSFNYSALFFDKSGQFVCQIGTEGHGPGEYSEIQDATISENGDIVVLVDSNNRLLVYDSKGNHIKTVKNAVEQRINDTYVLHICSCKDGYIVCTRMNAYLFDKAVNFVKVLIDGKFEDDINGENFTDIFYPNNSESNIFYKYCKYKSTLDVVNFNDTTLNKHYVFKSDNVATHEKLLDPSTVSRINFDSFDDCYYVMNGGLIKGNFTFDNPKKDRFEVKSIYFNTLSGKFALLDDLNAFERIKDYSNGYCYNIISSSDLLHMIYFGKMVPEESRKKMYYDAYKALGWELTPENNHVIIKFKLADNEEIPL